MGGAIQPGAIVIYESTVYPRATEEDRIPVIERINPGDRAHRVIDIVREFEDFGASVEVHDPVVDAATGACNDLPHNPSDGWRR